MRGQSFFDRLKSKFGDKITGSNMEALDPWIEVSPDGLVEVATYLREDPELRFKLAAESFSHGWELPQRHGGQGGRSGEGIPADARSKPG